MRAIFLYNSKNLLGESLIEFFLKDESNVVETTFDDFKDKMQDENVFIFNTSFLNEIDLINENYANEIIENLDKIFELTNLICKCLIETGKKGKFVFITTNPSLGNIIDFPTAPINDEAIHSFVKSLTKEMTPFNIIVNAVCVEPILEMLDKDELKIYRRKMKFYGVKKAPMKISEFLDAMQYVLANESHLFSGKIYYLGEGM
jgi:short-subunit dehydrogenase involved in D-alanine esterification of teichoic acids